MIVSLAKLNSSLSTYVKGKLNVIVHLLTIVHRLQYPTLSRAGISSSLNVVIKSSNLEMSLRSMVS